MTTSVLGSVARFSVAIGLSPRPSPRRLPPGPASRMVVRALSPVDGYEQAALLGVGELPIATSRAPRHKVTINHKARGEVIEVEVPEDRYIMHAAEEQGETLPFACRMGCCTACAVRVISGNLRQPQALGISQELKDKGYALLCVAFPADDVVVETQDEDEVYWKQFGQYFARYAIQRDDYALEIALGDE